MTAKLTIDVMQEIAKSRGGKCLSTKYVNSKTKLYWECSEGHRWSARPSDIKAGKWCRVCSYAKRKKVTTQTTDRHIG